MGEGEVAGAPSGQSRIARKRRVRRQKHSILSAAQAQDCLKKDEAIQPVFQKIPNWQQTNRKFLKLLLLKPANFP